MNSSLNKNVKVIDLGLADYKNTWDLQEQLLADTVGIKSLNRTNGEGTYQQTPNYVICCSHPHVYTLGKSGKENHLLLSQEQLSAQGIQFYKINRGGDITYHGPEQVVMYPILDLENFFTDIHKYLRALEEVVIRMLDDFGITGGRIPGLTGVWLDYDNEAKARKICAFGVKTSRWVTMHGLALNVNSDLSFFDQIIPCGIGDKAVTSMHLELGRQLDKQDVQEKLLFYMSELFQMELVYDEGH